MKTLVAAWNRWMMRRDQRLVHRALERVDASMKRAGATRAVRRRFWRDMIAGRMMDDIVGGPKT